jgi:hypothetical protein
MTSSVFGLQAGTRPGNNIFAVERAAPVAELDQTESFFPNSLSSMGERYSMPKRIALE